MFMSGQRITWRQAEQLRARLSDRDLAIVKSLDATRVLTGQQLTRLHFADLSPSTQDRTRRRVLQRLTEWRVLARLERVIGGVRAGSTGWVYRLDVAGQRLVQLATAEPPGGRIRPPWTPSLLFLAHSLAISEVYVGLVEATRTGTVRLSRFETEPASWWPDGLGGFLKPDAFLVLSGPSYDELVWLEVDRATESLPTLKRQLAAYLGFVTRGQLGPLGVMPHVVLSAPSPRRTADLQSLIDSLDIANRLFRVSNAEDTPGLLIELASAIEEPP
jgi:hypothetical protein